MYLYTNDSVMDWNDKLFQAPNPTPSPPPPPTPRGFRATFLDPLSLLYWGLGHWQYSGTPLYEHL